MTDKARHIARAIIALEEDWEPGESVDHDNLLASYAVELAEMVLATHNP